jgi:hypothetical protein
MIERCFLQLMVIAEAMGLVELYKMLLSEYSGIKASKKGFMEAKTDPNGEPFSNVISKIRQYLRAIEQFYPAEPATTVTKDVIQILRDIHYSITDKEVFHTVPKEEKDIHLRIESILRCVFPDLKHKPTLNKTIKNFIPDTGIPSIKTLIEYKFLGCADDVTVVADEVLADTRGYVSNEWKRLIYVIYETNRFRTEKQWNQFLSQSGVPETTTLIVLSGEPPGKKKTMGVQKQTAKR